MAMHSECSSLRGEHCLLLADCGCVATVPIELHPMRLDSGQHLNSGGGHGSGCCCYSKWCWLWRPEDAWRWRQTLWLLLASCDGQRAIGLRPNNKKDRRRWRCDSRRRWAQCGRLKSKESKVKASSFLAFLRLAKSEKHIITRAPLHRKGQREKAKITTKRERCSALSLSLSLSLCPLFTCAGYSIDRCQWVNESCTLAHTTSNNRA